MSSYEKHFLEGLRRLGIEGNLLEAIVKSCKVCFPMMEGMFTVHSPSERYNRESKITDEEVAKILNGLDSYERNIYDSMNRIEKQLFILDMINGIKNAEAADRSGYGIDKKIIDAYIKKFKRVIKHNDHNSRGWLLRARKKHEESKLSDAMFGGIPVSHRTHLYVTGMHDYSDEYKKSHPGENGTFTDLMLFVTDAVEDEKKLETYDWWDRLDDEEKKSEIEKSSKEHVIFAMRTHVGENNNDVVTSDEIIGVYNRLMNDESPKDIVGDVSDVSKLFAGFGKGAMSSGRGEANKLFSMCSSFGNHDRKEIKDLSELNGYKLISGERTRWDHMKKKTDESNKPDTDEVPYLNNMRRTLNVEDVNYTTVVSLIKTSPAHTNPALLDTYGILKEMIDRGFCKGEYSNLEKDDKLIRMAKTITNEFIGDKDLNEIGLKYLKIIEDYENGIDEQVTQENQ